MLIENIAGLNYFLFSPMQREALLTNAAMAITKLTNESNEVLHITHSKFGCGSAALENIRRKHPGV